MGGDIIGDVFLGLGVGALDYMYTNMFVCSILLCMYVCSYIFVYIHIYYIIKPKFILTVKNV